jgi:ketosteroid isomerase-like protein
MFNLSSVARAGGLRRLSSVVMLLARRFGFLVLAGLAASACGGAASAPEHSKTAAAPLAVAAAEADARCTVWYRELSFAAAVAAHDEAGFLQHVHPQAMFVEGEKGVTRGRDAILAEWKPIIAGQPVLLRWHPTSVVVADGAGTAVSRGPYVIEDPRPNAPARYKKGIFQSVWVKDADGAWRVLIDGGTPPPVAITNEEAERIKSELHTACTTTSAP